MTPPAHHVSVLNFRRWWIVSPIGALALAVIWSAGWWALTRAADSRIDAWLEHERLLGRRWVCVQRNITGFPFHISLNCDLANLVGEVAGQQIEAALQGLRAVVPLYQPTHIIAEAESPLTVNDLHGGRLNLNWASMQANIVAYPAMSEHLSLSLEKVDVRIAAVGWGEDAAQAAQAAIDLQPTAEKPRSSGSYDLSVRLEQAVVPAFDAWVGSAVPANLVLNGTISQAEFAGRGTPAERLERWRVAGGTFDITSMDLDKGDMHLSARGQIHLDESHRPSGQLEAELTGLEPLATKLGLPIAAVRLGVFGNLLAGIGKPKVSATASNEKIRVKLTFEKGRVMLGPIPTVVLPPLY
jgi:hypothetical protein